MLASPSDDKIPGAMKLFIEYLKTFAEQNAKGSKTSTDKFKDRLKLIAHCDNLEEFGLPSFITSYNAKPVLLRHVRLTFQN